MDPSIFPNPIHAQSFTSNTTKLFVLPLKITQLPPRLLILTLPIPQNKTLKPNRADILAVGFL